MTTNDNTTKAPSSAPPPVDQEQARNTILAAIFAAVFGKDAGAVAFRSGTTMILAGAACVVGAAIPSPVQPFLLPKVPECIALVMGGAGIISASKSGPK